MRTLEDLHALPDDALVTPPELGAILGVEPRLLAEWRIQGKHIGYEKIGHLVRYRMADVRAYRESRRKVVVRRSVR